MCIKRFTQNKDINQRIRNLVRDGWKFENSKHPRLISPGGRCIVVSGSPSDKNAHHQFDRDVRRIQGLESDKKRVSA